MNDIELKDALIQIGKQVAPQSKLVLIGGSALLLLGNLRSTLDIDFIGDDVNPNKLHNQIIQIAKQLKIDVEPVPLERFVPLPEGNEQRNIPIAHFENLEVFVADPYSIALSKVDRGLDSDFEDIAFLIQNNHINLNEFENILHKAIANAGKFDLHPDILLHLQELKSRLK